MLLIGNGKTFTRDSKNTYIENGAVAIQGTKIVRVGDTKELREMYQDAEYIDAKGKVIMPAFINTHEHIYSAMARGLSINGYNPQGFLDILDGQWWTIDRKLTLEQTRYSAIDTMISCIRNGVTTIFDHHAYLLSQMRRRNWGCAPVCVMRSLTGMEWIRQKMR